LSNKESGFGSDKRVILATEKGYPWVGAQKRRIVYAWISFKIIRNKTEYSRGRGKKPAVKIARLVFQNQASGGGEKTVWDRVDCLGKDQKQEIRGGCH